MSHGYAKSKRVEQPEHCLGENTTFLTFTLIEITSQYSIEKPCLLIGETSSEPFMFGSC